MKLGHNTKAAVLRLGLMEMVKFGELFIEGITSLIDSIIHSHLKNSKRQIKINIYEYW